jgi:hypothetical protein
MLNSVESEYQRKQYGKLTKINMGSNFTGNLTVGDDNTITAELK